MIRARIHRSSPEAYATHLYPISATWGDFTLDGGWPDFESAWEDLTRCEECPECGACAVTSDAGPLPYCILCQWNPWEASEKSQPAA